MTLILPFSFPLWLKIISLIDDFKLLINSSLPEDSKLSLSLFYSILSSLSKQSALSFNFSILIYRPVSYVFCFSNSSYSTNYSNFISLFKAPTRLDYNPLNFSIIYFVGSSVITAASAYKAFFSPARLLFIYLTTGSSSASWSFFDVN